MWNYEKRLQYPVNIKNPDGRIAQIIMSQYGGPDGEIGASLRYLSQRFSMPNRKIMGVLNDIGTEELAHLEIDDAQCFVNDPRRLGNWRRLQVGCHPCRAPRLYRGDHT